MHHILISESGFFYHLKDNANSNGKAFYRQCKLYCM